MAAARETTTLSKIKRLHQQKQQIQRLPPWWKWRQIC